MWCGGGSAVAVVVWLSRRMHEAGLGGWWWWCGHPAECARRGEGVWVQKPETERACSVSGVPCETAVQNDGEGWWCGVGVVLVVVRPSRPMCEAGRGGLDPKTRN